MDDITESQIKESNKRSQYLANLIISIGMNHLEETVDESRTLAATEIMSAFPMACASMLANLFAPDKIGIAQDFFTKSLKSALYLIDQSNEGPL